MPARIEIKGTGEFRRTAAKLKAAGRGDLTREMGKRMRVAAKPAVEDAKQNVRALNTSSSRGGGGQARRAFAQSKLRKQTERGKARAAEGRGLRATVARIIRAQVRTGGRTAGVQIKANSRQMPPDQRQLPLHMNTGRWRHPVFGNTRRWVTQTTSPPEWFDRAMRRHGRKIRDDAVKAIDGIIEKIAR